MGAIPIGEEHFEESSFHILMKVFFSHFFLSGVRCPNADLARGGSPLRKRSVHSCHGLYVGNFYAYEEVYRGGSVPPLLRRPAALGWISNNKLAGPSCSA